MDTVSGTCAFITGGASGIGLGIAQALAEAGARVIIADVNEEGAAAAAHCLREAGTTAYSIALNVADYNSWRYAIEFAQRQCGNIHILCNNAGVTGCTNTPLEEVSEAAWNWVRSVNLDGILNGLRAFVPHAKRHGEPAHIVNTGSMTSVLAFTHTGDYAATKFGVAGLSEVLRKELKDDNIGVSVLCPGVTRTSIISSSRRLMPVSAGDALPTVRDCPELEVALSSGLDPRISGRVVLKAILANRAYIFTHPEFRSLVQERFNSILADFDWATENTEAHLVDSYGMSRVSTSDI